MNQLTISDILFSLSELHDKVDRLLEKADDARTVAANVLIPNHEGSEYIPTDRRETQCDEPSRC